MPSVAMIKIFFVIVFLLILASLGSALFHLVKHNEEESSTKTAKALTIRIGLSLALFIIMAVLLLTGVIQPQGIGAKIQAQKTQTLESNK